MKNKKLLFSILTCGLLMSLCSCGNKNSISGQIDRVTPPSSVQQTYIKDIKAVGAYWDKYAYNGAGVLKDKYGQDYSRLSDWNLNCDCGTTKDCIYLYESRTIHAEEAITDIIVVTQRSASKNFVYKDHNYEIVSGIRVNGLNSSKTEYDRFDLNMNAGGDYIYLCVSRDTNGLKPITDFKVGGISAFNDDANYSYLMNMTNTSEFQNLNSGTGGTAIYGAITCVITGWIINDVEYMDRNKNGEYFSQTITLDTEKKTLTEEQLQPIIDKGEGAYFQGYYSRKILEDGEKITTSTQIPYDFTIWAHWTYDITVDYTAVGGDIKNFTKVNKFQYFSEYGMYYLVFQETGKTVSGGPHWPGTYVAVAYEE